LPTPTLFPYTTLFRSLFTSVRYHRIMINPQQQAALRRMQASSNSAEGLRIKQDAVERMVDVDPTLSAAQIDAMTPLVDGSTGIRSEEHTSELQSRVDL